MAEFRRPSRLALALVAVVLPALVGLTFRGLISCESVDATPCCTTATGVSVELPPAPSARLWKSVGAAEQV